MTVPAERDTTAADALLTDLYLDALLAGAMLGPTGGTPAEAAAATLDPAARRAADRLRRDLVRVHPSFRFEERLATRLAEAATAMRVPVAAGAEGRLVAFHRGVTDDVDPLAPGAHGHLDAERLAGAGGPLSAGARLGPGDSLGAVRRTPGRPLLIGGALTSAALSIAGAAWVAWRLGRPNRAATPMARAARAVREARLMAAPSGRGAGVISLNGVSRRRPN